MSINLDKALGVTPPTKPYVRATSATTTEFELPAAFNKSWINIRAEGQKVWFRFVVAAAGVASGAALLETSVSGLTGEVLDDDADAAFLIEAGQEMPYDLSTLKLDAKQAIKIIHKSPAASGFIRLYLSSGPVA